MGARVRMGARVGSPSESESSRVSFESRKGTCAARCGPASAAMQLPSAATERLIVLASSSLRPSDPDLLTCRGSTALRSGASHTEGCTGGVARGPKGLRGR
jgi:hypothetical protein